MSQSAFIKFVDGSTVASVTLDELKESFEQYKAQTSLTGKQLDWNYTAAAFPYEMITKPEAEDRWFYLKGTSPNYKFIVMGVGSEMVEETEGHFVQIVLPDESSYADKSKANEFCKYLGKKWKATVTLFNGRNMYFNPRK